MSLLVTIVASLFISLTNATKAISSEKLFNVVTSDPSADKRAVAFVDTVTGKDRIVEVNMSGEVVWEWKFPDKLISKRRRHICKGADIKYLHSSDEILFIIPRSGAYIVNRAGNYKTVIEDDKITHDIDLLPNGNFIYTRGFVNKGDDEVREITPSGKVIWKWSHAKYFPNRKLFLKVLSNRRKRKNLKSDGIDWAHVNGVERYKNGNTLISLRNFNMFVLVGPDSNPIKTFQNISFVHEPHKTTFGYIAADRFAKKGHLLHSIIKITNEGKRTKLLKGQFKTVRGIESLPSGRFNITSVGNVFEINSEGKIFQQMHLKIMKEDTERNLNRRTKSVRKIFNKGRCRPLNLYKVAKTKLYK
ncbi:aryl-sulfate sulfotransferase [Bacteriovoracales bacterium]|nr:aryl-sulfate sulfotransferase [Bacteriovoracales bacterium]